MYKKIVTAAVFVLVTVSTGGFQSLPFTTAQVQSNSTTVDSDCINKMTNEEHSKAITLDNAKAVSMATNQTEFKSKTQGFTANYSSTFNTWKLDPVNCTVSWNDVNVGYQLYNGTRYVKNIVVTLDPALTHVMKVDDYVAPTFVTATSNGIWSGYEFEGSSLPPVTSSFIGTAGGNTYRLPSVTKPTFTNHVCRTDLGTFQPCDTSIWTGLEDTIGATNGHLVQAGTDGEITCSGSDSSCTTSYFLWYDFYPNAGFTCSNALMAPNDVITLNVTNDAKALGGLNTNYDLSLQDTTHSFGCTVTRQSYTSMTTPTYAPFILERAQETSNMKGYPATLAVFGNPTPTIPGKIFYSNFYNGLSSATIAAKWTMSNQNNNNTRLGSISSDSFSETWLASDGTYGTCVPPRTGDLVVSASCTVPNNAAAHSGNVEVQSGDNLLTIPSGFTLTIPFSTNHLKVDTSGGLAGVLIKVGGKISS